MNYSELIQLYFERSTALQWYWTVYILVIGGVLGFSTFRHQRDRLTTLLVSILYCFFAYKNLGAIHDVTLQRYAVLEAIKLISAPATAPEVSHVWPALNSTLVAPDFAGIRNFHIVTDILTVASLWSMELRRKRMAMANAQTT